MAIHRVVHENPDFYFVAEDKIMLLNMKGLCQKKIGFQHKPFPCSLKWVFTPSFFSHPAMSSIRHVAKGESHQDPIHF